MKIFSHTDWQPGFDILCDYSRIEDFDVTYQDINDLSEWHTSIDAMIGEGRCAVAASKDALYGITRIWEILSSESLQHICVFRQIKDAVLWLGCPAME